MDEPSYHLPAKLTREQQQLVAGAELRARARDAGRQLYLTHAEHHPPSRFFWDACNAMWTRIAAVLPSET